jgi:hypothetical protein
MITFFSFSLDDSSRLELDELDSDLGPQHLSRSGNHPRHVIQVVNKRRTAEQPCHRPYMSKFRRKFASDSPSRSSSDSCLVSSHKSLSDPKSATIGLSASIESWLAHIRRLRDKRLHFHCQIHQCSQPSRNVFQIRLRKKALGEFNGVRNLPQFRYCKIAKFGDSHI